MTHKVYRDSLPLLLQEGLSKLKSHVTDLSESLLLSVATGVSGSGRNVRSTCDCHDERETFSGTCRHNSLVRQPARSRRDREETQIRVTEGTLNYE